MLIRAIVLALLLLNLGFLAWGQGWLDPLLGAAAHAGREPERLKRQVTPDAIKVFLPGSPQAAASGPPAVCLESPVLSGDEALRAATAALDRAGVSAGNYADQRSQQPGEWAVATIKMFNRDFQARKEETLKRMRVPFEPLKGYPAEDPSLLISRHASQAEAEKALDALSQRLIKGLRVMMLVPPTPLHRLRIEQADAALQAKLSKLKDPALGAGFARCTAPANGAEAATSAVPAPAASSTVAPAASAASR
jgi:hypothetical protein